MNLIWWGTCERCNSWHKRRNLIRNVYIGVCYPWTLCNKCYDSFVDDTRTHEEQDDDDYQQYLRNKEIATKNFERIVGESPMAQIDWITKHGFDSFCEWEKRCNKGLKMYNHVFLPNPQPAPKVRPDPSMRPKGGLVEVNSKLDFFGSRAGSSLNYVRGGMGNKKLLSWHYNTGDEVRLRSVDNE